MCNSETRRRDACADPRTHDFTIKITDGGVSGVILSIKLALLFFGVCVWEGGVVWLTHHVYRVSWFICNREITASFRKPVLTSLCPTIRPLDHIYHGVQRILIKSIRKDFRSFWNLKQLFLNVIGQYTSTSSSRYEATPIVRSKFPFDDSGHAFLLAHKRLRRRDAKL